METGTPSITREITWEQLADATIEHRADAARAGRDLAAQTPPIALARKARHRKPNRRRSVVRTALGALALAVVTGSSIASAAATPPTLPIVPPAAVLAAYGHAAPVSWHARTCQAFYAWDAHRTSAHLDTLMTDSEHVPWRWLGGDVLNVYRDIRGHNSKYLGDDATAVNQDCGG